MNLSSLLQSILPQERIKTRLIDLYAYASDASFYYLIPKAVIQPISVEEIQALFDFSKKYQINLTFRAGGTSLSGQAVTDGILVDLSQHWRKIQVEGNGESVRVQVGAVGGAVNTILKKYKKKIGPDPSSINAAMMGGILSNNSSGMCCGVAQNSYHTLQYIKFVLPNGLVFNTENKEDYRKFEEEAKVIYEGISSLRKEILDNTPLSEKIRKKYKMKNTVGYGLNAFIDYQHPLDILAHLLIGGEGTLGFIAEAVLKTVPDYPYKLTGMLYFSNIQDACNAILPLKESGVEALELMDFPALKSIEHLKGAPEMLKSLTGDQTALLAEYQANTEEELKVKFENAFNQYISTLPLLIQPEFTKDAYEQANLWKLRKGLYPSVAAVRQKGSAVLLEDVAFPIENLGAGIADLRKLFEKYNYTSANIIGHAKDGNLHFILTQLVNEEKEINRYADFIEEMVEVVVKKYHGALKGEHGTGRNMAPFIETEWGEDAYQIMKKLKELIDPEYLINTGVIINADKKAHLKYLKTLPIVEEEVDKCVECGYCENRCPSRDFTLTPRQRIGIRRALQRLAHEGKKGEYEEILKEYKFAGLDTCATDGMCATDCPVDINTGELVKRLRRENHSPTSQKNALRIAKNFHLIENMAIGGIKIGKAVNTLFGKKAMKTLTSSLRSIYSEFPLWNGQLDRVEYQKIKYPTPPAPQSNSESHLTNFVYFPTCISRMMGKDTLSTFLSVAHKARFNILIPNDIQGHCCGQAFSSKGFAEAYQFTANKTIESLWKWTKQGELPVVLDVTSCTHTLQQSKNYLTEENKVKFDKMKFLDSIDFIADYVLERIPIQKQKERIVFHPVCSVYKMNLMKKLEKIGNACAKNAVIPQFAGCCGMAGDRSFFVPELTKSATKTEAAEVKLSDYQGYYSSAKTCEMAMSEAVGKNYVSILNLIDEVSE
jgi:D-lactate dehydrogenase